MSQNDFDFILKRASPKATDAQTAVWSSDGITLIKSDTAKLLEKSSVSNARLKFSRYSSRGIQLTRGSL